MTESEAGFADHQRKRRKTKDIYLEYDSYMRELTDVQFATLAGETRPHLLVASVDVCPRRTREIWKEICRLKPSTVRTMGRSQFAWVPP